MKNTEYSFSTKGINPVNGNEVLHYWFFIMESGKNYGRLFHVEDINDKAGKFIAFADDEEDAEGIAYSHMEMYGFEDVEVVK